MEDELWLEKIKDKLKDYSEPLLVAGWERLEKELSVSGTPIARPHKMIPFHRWAVLRQQCCWRQYRPSVCGCCRAR